MKIRFTYSYQNRSIMRERRQKEGGGLMYFCITFPNGLILLRELVGKQKGENYKILFNTVIVPAIRLNMGMSANLAQDNCSIHTSRNVRQCYDTNDINIIPWPSKSPDINIVENIWKAISDIVYDGNQPKSIPELRIKVNEAVNIINNDKRSMIVKMYNNFRSRLTKVLIANGNIIN